ADYTHPTALAAGIQTVRRCVAHEIGGVRQSHLLHEPRAIRAHGFWRQTHELRDLLHAEPSSERTEHLELAVGEQLVGCAVEAGAEVRRKSLGERGAHVSAATVDATDGVEQLLR